MVVPEIGRESGGGWGRSRQRNSGRPNTKSHAVGVSPLALPGIFSVTPTNRDRLMLTLTPTIGEAGWDECESVIRRFEDAWRDRGRPDIGAFVTPDSPHSGRLLLELVHIDLEFRLRAGEAARTEDYLARFPQLRDEALDLLEAEFTLRNRHRPPAYPEEFWLRFPEHMTELRDRLPDAAAELEATRPAQSAGPRLPTTPAIPGYEILGELGR